MPPYRSGRFGEPGGQTRRPDAPFPWESVRDLLGIVRALYKARAAGHGRGSLMYLQDVGEKLAKALELGRGARPYTKRHRTAWELAEEAVALLGWYLTREETLRPVFDEAGKRITGEKPPGPERPPERRKLG